MTRYIVLLLYLVHVSYSKEISVEKTLVYGPGLNPDIVVPVRYIYVQAVDTDGKNFTESPGKDAFTFEFSGWIRVWREVLDRNDGSFIIRFRLYETYKDLELIVKHKKENVANSPYTLKGAIYHEQCNCPEPNITKYNNMISCPSDSKQIDDDFKRFPSIDLKQLTKDAIDQFVQDSAICHYSIINNEIHRKCYGEITGFSYLSDDWFLSMARKVRLPDMEFWFNLGDYPRSEHWHQKAIPVISWGSSNEANDIVIPTYDLTKSALEALGRVSLDMMSVQGNTGPSWDQKIEKGFFRGRDSRPERLELTIMGRKNTELFDIGLTNFFFFDYDEEKYGPKHKHVSFFDFFNYKYQLNVDGTVAAYRLPYLLAGDAVVFKQESEYYEHFYSELEPWVHYIPFKRDLSDIEERLLWAKANDEKARNIALAGQRYARDNLTSERLYCYTLRVFQEYAKRQEQTPKIHEGMEHVKQDDGPDSNCKCLKMSGKANEHEEL